MVWTSEPVSVPIARCVARPDQRRLHSRALHELRVVRPLLSGVFIVIAASLWHISSLLMGTGCHQPRGHSSGMQEHGCSTTHQRTGMLTFVIRCPAARCLPASGACCCLRHDQQRCTCRVVRNTFDPTIEDSDTGWVTGAGMGAFQVLVPLSMTYLMQACQSESCHVWPAAGVASRGLLTALLILALLCTAAAGGAAARQLAAAGQSGTMHQPACGCAAVRGAAW